MYSRVRSPVGTRFSLACRRVNRLAGKSRHDHPHCEAAGVTGIFLLSPNDDPWDPAAVRASMGSLYSQKLVMCSAREFTDWAKSSGVAIVGSSPTGLLDYKFVSEFVS